MTRILSLVAALFLFCTVSAHAGIEIRAWSIIGSPDGTYSYSYKIRLVSGKLDPSSVYVQHVTLYDIPGLLPGSVTVSTGAPFSASVATLGTDPVELPRSGADSPTLLNVTLRYNGASVLAAPVDLGTFSFTVSGVSTASGPLFFASQSTSLYRGPVSLLGRAVGPVALKP